MTASNPLAEIVQDPRLPTLPPLVVRVLERAGHRKCVVGDLARLVGSDAALGRKLLKAVNSSLYALPRAIGSLDRAMNLLGVNRVRSLVLALSLPELRLAATGADVVNDFWRHAVVQAMVARELALRLRCPDADSEMAAGLLCDLGVLFLNEVRPDRYRRVLDTSPDLFGDDLCELETRHVGVHHAEAGAYVLAHWGVPRDVTTAIRHHHDPAAAAAHADRAHRLQFAAKVARLQYAIAPADLSDEIAALARDRFGMDVGQLDRFLAALGDRVDQLATLLGVDMERCDDFAERFRAATASVGDHAGETSADHLRATHDPDAIGRALCEAQAPPQPPANLEAAARLAGTVARDFDNLLTVILGGAELALSNAAADAGLRRSLESIRSAAQQAARLTTRLLAFGADVSATPVPLNLNDVLADTEGELRRQVGPDIRLAVIPHPSLPCVWADAAQVEQILVNLVANARDALPEGGMIVVSTDVVRRDERPRGNGPAPPAGDYVCLQVTDSGTGMDDDVLARVFEPLFTTKGAGRGAGLGLPILYRIVTENHGHIAVASRPGDGTTVRIFLPVVPVSAGAPGAPAPAVRTS
jgi:signal transduction histidine kinase